MTTHKKARDTSGVSKDRREKYEALSEEEKARQCISGVFHDQRVQATPTLKTAPSQKCLRGPDNNAFIIIGNDRVEKLDTGYGGKGHTQCDAIDLVAGMGGYSPKESEEMNPNFFVDAARIYISQKTDVDKNFGIGEFGKAEKKGTEDKPKNKKNGGKMGAKSAVAVKADNVRLIGRETIRLVTGTDDKNSQNGTVLAKSGIEIIAMNDTTTLQPLVLGDNLTEFLKKVCDNIDNVSRMLHGYMKYQMKFNEAISSHWHHSPFFASPTAPSEEVLTTGMQCTLEQAMNTELSVVKMATNMQTTKINYLSPGGKKYINSRLNKVN
jgi:hypothetical protein